MFKEIAPYVITATLIICAVIAVQDQETRHPYHRRHIRRCRIRVRTIHNVFEPHLQHSNNYLIDFFGTFIGYRMLAISAIPR